MLKSKTFFLLFLILFLSLFLRIYKLTEIPNSMSADEAAFGYNAYSILESGRDEFGYKYPLYFRSFDDYKNPVLGYVLVPFIKYLGLNDWVIRLPSVISGIGVVLFVFLVAKELTKKSKLALIASFFGSISPWLIQYSRVAIEMELALFFSLAGVFFFLISKKNKFNYIIASFLFGLSFYTYHSSKVWVPIFGLIMLLTIKSFNKYILAGLILFLAIITPYALLLKTSKLATRPVAISVFSNKEELISDARLQLTDIKENIWGGNLIHNRRLTAVNQAINGYLKILNPAILFAQGRSNQIASTRLFYLWQIPLIIVGLISLLKNKYLLFFTVSWLLIGFIPGGLTIFTPYDRRILLISFPLIFISAIGFYEVWNSKFINNTSASGWWKGLMLFLILASFYLYGHNYFVHGRFEAVESWSSGSKEVIKYTSKEAAKYEKIIVSIKSNQPLTFFLYYLKYPPNKYLEEGGTVSGGYLSEQNKFNKYFFKNITPADMSDKILYVWKFDEKQPCLQPTHRVYMSDGTPISDIGIFRADLRDCQTWLLGNNLN